jgi:hypothetical protein
LTPLRNLNYVNNDAAQHFNDKLPLPGKYSASLVMTNSNDTNKEIDSSSLLMNFNVKHL